MAETKTTWPEGTTPPVAPVIPVDTAPSSTEIEVGDNWSGAPVPEIKIVPNAPDASEVGSGKPKETPSTVEGLIRVERDSSMYPEPHTADVNPKDDIRAWLAAGWVRV